MNNFSEIQADLQKELNHTTHVILKLGTNSIAPHIADPSLTFFQQLAEQIKKIQSTGKKVLIVSSGAVGLGKKLIFQDQQNPRKTKQFSLVEKQALASLGQSQLIDLYRKGFAQHSILPAQILVSASDFFNDTHYRNLKHTIDQLLDWQAVPVINENDTVATYGLKLGDNDTLSALIAAMYPNALLLLLTTIDGFYLHEKKVDVISKITQEHLHAAGRPSAGGIGGMRTKLRAARKLLQSGQIMNICSGEHPPIIESILSAHNQGTWFYAPNAQEKPNAKKRWILHNNRIQGSLRVDQGAKKALLENNASLLGVGIISFSGVFDKGDLVEIKDAQGKPFGKGIVSCHWQTLEEALRLNSFEKGNEIIHRDNFIQLHELN